jgi:chromosome segregation ATPase
MEQQLNKLEKDVSSKDSKRIESLNEMDNRLTKVETYVEGLPAIRDEIKALDTKIDKLNNTIIKFFGTQQ